MPLRPKVLAITIQLAPSACTIIASYCRLRARVVAPSMVCEEVVATVTTLAVLSIFLTTYTLPVMPTEVGSVIDKAPVLAFAATV